MAVDFAEFQQSERLAHIEGTLGQMDKRLSRVESELSELRSSIDSRFNAVDGKFNWVIGITLMSWLTIVGLLPGIISKK